MTTNLEREREGREGERERDIVSIRTKKEGGRVKLTETCSPN